MLISRLRKFDLSPANIYIITLYDNGHECK